MGRLCRRASGIPFSEIPDEPAGTVRARNELLRSLATAAAKIPGDNWIVGQRVRYLIEAGNDTAAAVVARECVATRWWCDALAGLAAHASQRYVAAERAFALALQEMPKIGKCEWTDLSVLLEGDASSAYDKLDCDSREAANRRIWWLADPLFSTPGNERRTEHFARRAWAEIERDGANGFGMRWGKDMEEMIVRFGWAEKWTQQPPSGMNDAATYVAHEREPDFHFISPARYDAPISTLGDSAWNLFDEDPREGYSPRYASAFTSISPQVSRFRRGDSTLIVTAFDVRADTVWKYDAVHPTLVIAPSDTSRFLLAVFDSTPRRSALWITSPSREALASLELLSLDGKVAGRWRGSVRPLTADTARRSISDILLFDATDSLASEIEGAIATAYGTNVLPRDKKVGVYWETYGRAADDSASEVSLTLTPMAPGLVTRVLRSLGVGKKLAPVDVRWRDTGPESELQPRSVTLDLSQVTPGRYDFRVTVGTGASARSTSRPVVIERGSSSSASIQ